MRGLIYFGGYVVVEGAITIWLASVVGWAAVLGFYGIGLVVGILVIRDAGLKAVRGIRDAAASGGVPAESMGDSGTLFAGGTLVAIPGLLTDVLGLLLIVPITRRLLQRQLGLALARNIRRRGVTVVTTTSSTGATVTRVVPGDVIQGEIVERGPTEDSGGPRPPTSAR